MIVIAPYGIHALTERRPELTDMSIAAKVTEATRSNA